MGSRIILQQKPQKLVQRRKKSHSEGSSQQKERLGSVARSDK